MSEMKQQSDGKKNLEQDVNLSGSNPVKKN